MTEETKDQVEAEEKNVFIHEGAEGTTETLAGDDVATVAPEQPEPVATGVEGQTLEHSAEAEAAAPEEAGPAGADLNDPPAPADNVVLFPTPPSPEIDPPAVDDVIDADVPPPAEKSFDAPVGEMEATLFPSSPAAVMATNSEPPLPLYRCHKLVRALQIGIVTPLVDGGADLAFNEPNFESAEVAAAFVQKHNPQPGDYLVLYEDGYQSISPWQAFEDGYTRVEKLAPENVPAPVLASIVSEGAHLESIRVTEEANDIICISFYFSGGIITSARFKRGMTPNEVLGADAPQ